MEVMYNKTRREFILITDTEAIQLVPYKTYQDVPTMVEDIKEPLADFMVRARYDKFPQPPLNLGVWFSYPESPKYPNHMYFVQQDGSVTLYNFTDKVKIPNMKVGIAKCKELGFDIYYKMN